MSSPHRAPPYRLVALENKPGLRERRFTVAAGTAVFGGGLPVVVAGPCAVESREQVLAAAHAALACGASMLRGGVFKTRTSPYDFQGLSIRGLDLLADARGETGLPFVTEVIDPRHVAGVAAVADMIQIGTRNMHNTPLLKEAGRCGKPVLLKRGWASTIREWLCAAEYLAVEGCLSIVLCERGVRLDPRGSHAAPEIDFGAVAELKKTTFLPVVVDPSHGTENSALVPGACSKAMAAGADGLVIEILPPGWSPDRVKCDGHQSVTPDVLSSIIASLGPA